MSAGGSRRRPARPRGTGDRRHTRRPMIVTVVGARPQFVKAAVVSRVLRRSARELLVHTGQHHDDTMSAAFFRELAIPEPYRNLGIHSGDHGEMTGRMLEALERLLLVEHPDLVLVYGDTNSTLAGALAAVKHGIPVAHVEAGLRSYDPGMPEEINRRLTDHVSTLLFCPTSTAVRNLAREGIRRGVHLVGDVMMDALLRNLPRARRVRTPLGRLTQGSPYYVVTLHRQENVDVPERLGAVIEALGRLPHPVVFPVHPRTRRRLGEFDLRCEGALRITQPLSYVQMLHVVAGARAVLTDSGGLQKEAFMLGVPCVTLRGRTEWPETLAGGANRLAAEPSRIVAAVTAIEKRRPCWDAGRVYGDGQAAQRIATILIERLRRGIELTPSD